jgi:hypothetical protein
VLTVPDAFEKFKKRLELTSGEQKDASKRQMAIREQVRAELSLETDFLTGSYARDTKTKPLKDVDIFLVLAETEDDYLQRHPADILDRLVSMMSPHYPGMVSKGNRSTKIDFGIGAPTDDQVVSFDVVPAFADGEAFRIPDQRQSEWIKTNPKTHAEKATNANAVFDLRWKPTVKMLKKWNDHHDKPIKPSFLIEVMALELLSPPWGGSYAREARQFFASATTAIMDAWKDPADLGPEVTARLAENPSERTAAKQALQDAERVCTEALRLEQSGRTGAALDAWQTLFGPRFAKT